MIVDSILAVTMIVSLGFVGLLVARRWQLSPLPFWGIASVLILVGLLTQLPVGPLSVGLSDGGLYRDWGFEISESWSEGLPWSGRALWPGKGLWPLAIAVLNYLFGPVLISLVVLNALIFAFSIILLQKATDLLFGYRPKWTIIVLVVSSPPVLLWAPTLFREAIFWFGISAGILAIAYFYRGANPFGVGFLLLSITVTLGIRPNLGVAIVYPLVVVGITVWALNKGRPRLGRTFVGATLVAVLIATFLPVSNFLIQTDSAEETVARTADYLSRDEVTTALKRSPEAPAGVCDQISYLPVLCNSLAAPPALMFGPFLWEIGPEPIWIVLIASTAHFLFLLTTSILLLFQKRKRTIASLSLLGLSLVTLIVLAAVMTNYGIIMRFRTVAELFLIPLSLAFLLGLRRDSSRG
jgi:hypothetical protein